MCIHQCMKTFGHSRIRFSCVIFVRFAVTDRKTRKIDVAAEPLVVGEFAADGSGAAVAEDDLPIDGEFHYFLFAVDFSFPERR